MTTAVDTATQADLSITMCHYREMFNMRNKDKSNPKTVEEAKQFLSEESISKLAHFMNILRVMNIKEYIKPGNANGYISRSIIALYKARELAPTEFADIFWNKSLYGVLVKLEEDDLINPIIKEGIAGLRQNAITLTPGIDQFPTDLSSSSSSTLPSPSPSPTTTENTSSPSSSSSSSSSRSTKRRSSTKERKNRSRSRSPRSSRCDDRLKSSTNKKHSIYIPEPKWIDMNYNEASRSLFPAFDIKDRAPKHILILGGRLPESKSIGSIVLPKLAYDWFVGDRPDYIRLKQFIKHFNLDRVFIYSRSDSNKWLDISLFGKRQDVAAAKNQISYMLRL